MKRQGPATAPMDSLSPKGRVEIFSSAGRPTLVYGERVPRSGIWLELEKAGRLPPVYKSCDIDFSRTKLLDTQDLHNIIVNTGKDKVIESLTTGFVNVIARMAVGDLGTIPADPTVPKIPLTTQSALFNEVYRDDIDSAVLNVGTPTVHEVKFIKTFSSLVIPITAFSNQATPRLNEVGLVTADIGGAAPLPRPPVAFPAVPDADEALFSLRTFKSVPFEAANEISVTIRYTIYIE